MDGYWIIRTYEAGAIGEKTKFFVPGQRPSGKDRRKERSEIKKQEQNEYASVKTVARLLNANFSHKDILLGLDYSEAGLKKITAAAEAGLPDGADEAERIEAIRREAEHELALCIRRVKRAMQADGLELKYVAVTADTDGDSGEFVRVHHHLVVSEGAEQVFLKKWNLGGVAFSALWQQDDYMPVAEYLLKQVRRVKDQNKYLSSRNLERPQPQDRVATDAELRAPQGAELLYRQEYRVGCPQYIRYLLPEAKREKARQRKERRRTVRRILTAGEV